MVRRAALAVFRGLSHRMGWAWLDRGRVKTVGLAVVTTIAVIGAATLVDAQGAIPDEGLPEELVVPDMSNRTEPLLAGVTGVLTTGDSERRVNTPVLAIAEWNNTIFIGGKFSNVNGNVNVSQRYLAAFDKNTGAWISTFRPTLDGTVWDLAVVDGKLIVAGQFTNVNGVSQTQALAALDPATGQVINGWRANIAVTGTSQRPMIRAIDVEGPWIYIGGNFTRVTGPNGITRSRGRLARVRVSDGLPDGVFKPNVGGGVVYELDATPTDVYIVGRFTSVDGIPQSRFSGMSPTGAVNTALAQKVDTDWRPTWSYQQGVLAVDDEIWLTGSQHNTQVYQRSNMSLIEGWGSYPWGDGQALAEVNGLVFAGNHARPGTDMYKDVDGEIYTSNGWDLGPYTYAGEVQWIAAFDRATETYRSDWIPAVGTQNGEGAWTLHVDSDECLWAGGDFNRGSYVGNTPMFAGGFVKFCSTDQVAPSVPTDVNVSQQANGVRLIWPASTDNEPGPISYDIFRNDQMIATGVTFRTYDDIGGTANDRYFIRSVDQAGNKSATTSVLQVADDQAPSTPLNLSGSAGAGNVVSLAWGAASDNVGVTGYAVYRNGVELTQVAGLAASLDGLPLGDNYLQVQAFDAVGNRGNKTSPLLLTLVGGDTQAPSTPLNLVGSVGAGNVVSLSWGAASDNVGVTGYAVFRNGVELTQVTDLTADINGLPLGNNYLQVQAFDAAGNRGNKTSPLLLTLVGGDTQAPSTPLNLVGSVGAGNVVSLSWGAASDNVGVTGYAVFRNGVELTQVTDLTADINGLPLGNNYLQVQAFDAAGNRGNKTAPLLITLL